MASRWGVELYQWRIWSVLELYVELYVELYERVVFCGWGGGFCVCTHANSATPVIYNAQLHTSIIHTIHTHTHITPLSYNTHTHHPKHTLLPTKHTQNTPKHSLRVTWHPSTSRGSPTCSMHFSLTTNWKVPYHLPGVSAGCNPWS